MRLKYILMIVLFVITLAVIFVLFAAGSFYPATAKQTNTPSVVGDAQVEPDEFQVDTHTLISPTVEPAVSQMTPLPDGASLLEKHCAQCHITKSLKQTEKPRLDWEKTLRQMEAMGVRLSDIEKDVLLNYLTPADIP